MFSTQDGVDKKNSRAFRYSSTIWCEGDFHLKCIRKLICEFGKYFRISILLILLQGGLCKSFNLDNSSSSSGIKIQHVTELNNVPEEKSRFPKLEECAHFHYDHVEIGSLQVSF